MTDAQKLVGEFRAITQPGGRTNTWKWAKRVTADLTPLGNSTIGDHRHANRRHSIALFRCPDGSRFAYDINGALQVWAMPHDMESI